MTDHDEHLARLTAQIDALEAAFDALRFPIGWAALDAREGVAKG